MCGGGGIPVVDDAIDLVKDTKDKVVDAGNSVVDTVSNVGQSAIDTVKDVGASIDQGIRDNVPGGWTTAALLAAGAYYAPETGAWLSADGTPVEAVAEGNAAGGAGAAAEGSASAAETLYPDMASSDAMAADNIDVGGGFNPATGAGDAATAQAAAETGVTSSAAENFGASTELGAADATAADATAADAAGAEEAASGGVDLSTVASGVLAGQAIGTLLTQLTQPARAPSTPVASNDPLQTDVAAGSRNGINATGGTSNSIQGVSDTLLTKKLTGGSSSTLLGA